LSGPFILDIDTGIDDPWLALLYACAPPEVEHLAVTCVAGNVGVELAQGGCVPEVRTRRPRRIP
jgi:inosine-uridine nucleoside N-ribohydrolase